MEVADILRAQGDPFLERYQSSFSYQQLKAFRAILRCRTAALGGHIDVCSSAVMRRVSLITPVEIAVARSARRRLANDGSRRGNRNCSTPATSTSCSPCLTNSTR